jgi:hypothetical protein
VAFLHLDFDWGAPRPNTRGLPRWPQSARRRRARARGGERRDGTASRSGGSTGAAEAATRGGWTQRACIHIEAGGIEPNHLVFVSWNGGPTPTFPASDPTAVTSLIPYAFQRRR